MKNEGAFDFSKKEMVAMGIVAVAVPVFGWLGSKIVSGVSTLVQTATNKFKKNN